MLYLLVLNFSVTLYSSWCRGPISTLALPLRESRGQPGPSEIFECLKGFIIQPLGHRAGPPVASSNNRQRIISKYYRRLLGYSLQRNILHRALLPPGPSGLVLKGDGQSNVQRVRLSTPAWLFCSHHFRFFLHLS